MSDGRSYLISEPGIEERASSRGIQASILDPTLEKFILETSISTPKPVDGVITDFVTALRESTAGTNYMQNAGIVLGYVKGLGGKVLDVDTQKHLADYLENRPERNYNYAAITSLKYAMTLKNDGSAFWFHFKPVLFEDASQDTLLSLYSNKDYTALTTFLTMFQPGRGDPTCPLGSVSLDDALRNYASANCSVNLNATPQGSISIMLKDTVKSGYKRLYSSCVEKMVDQDPFVTVMNSSPAHNGEYHIDLFIKTD